MTFKTWILCALLATAAWAAPGEHLKQGQTLPPIQESDQGGQQQTLKELAGPKGTILVVFRSADW